jgi:LysB family phage lysis regulatory protein
MKAFAAAIIIALVAVLLVGIQQYRIKLVRDDVVTAQGERDTEKKAKQEAVDANLESQATITTLRAEAQRNADYQKDLNKRLQASQAKARKAEKSFEDLKRNSKPVRDWAAQPLPDGLRGKTVGSDKDPGRKAGGT